MALGPANMLTASFFFVRTIRRRRKSLLMSQESDPPQTPTPRAGDEAVGRLSFRFRGRRRDFPRPEAAPKYGMQSSRNKFSPRRCFFRQGKKTNSFSAKQNADPSLASNTYWRGCSGSRGQRGEGNRSCEVILLHAAARLFTDADFRPPPLVGGGHR